PVELARELAGLVPRVGEGRDVLAREAPHLGAEGGVLGGLVERGGRDHDPTSRPSAPRRKGRGVVRALARQPQKRRGRGVSSPSAVTSSGPEPRGSPPSATACLGGGAGPGAGGRRLFRRALR